MEIDGGYKPYMRLFFTKSSWCGPLIGILFQREHITCLYDLVGSMALGLTLLHSDLPGRSECNRVNST